MAILGARRGGRGDEEGLRSMNDLAQDFFATRLTRRAPPMSFNHSDE
jgi:hypothetical protein